MIKEIKRKLAEELHAFRAGSMNRDLIFGIRQLTEKNWKYGKEFLMMFIDFKKGCDSMKREEFWNI
jgi:hypothetical protein